MQNLSHRSRAFFSMLRYGWIVAVVIAEGLLPSQGTAAEVPGFRCRPKLSDIERAVCSQLDDYDVALNAIYNNMVADAVPADRKVLTREQRKWLLSRDAACPHETDANAFVGCQVELYNTRIDELVAERSRLGLPDDRSALRPGDTAFVGGVAMHCESNAVRLHFTEPAPGPYDPDDKRAQQMPVPPSRGVLDAAWADCHLSDGNSIRVKTGQTGQQMAYGMCGGVGGSQLSVWIDHRKVVSSQGYALCEGGVLDSLSITKTKADFCLKPGFDFHSLESYGPYLFDKMKLTHGQCGDIPFAVTPGPDPREFPADGKPLPEPGALSLEATESMRPMCERLLLKEDADDPAVPDDMPHPDWKEATVKLPQPSREGLIYDASTLSEKDSIDSAIFDLENTGTGTTVYMLDNSGNGFDGTAMAADRKDILVTPFDVEDPDASLAKGIHVWAEDHASVFFDRGKTYVLLDPTTQTRDPKVIALHGKLQETVCTFHRAQENF